MTVKNKIAFSHWRLIVLLILVLGNLFVWLAVWKRSPSDTLSVWFFNIGHGDALLIESPTHKRILIDGGPNRKVLSELGRALPFGDKRIDMVIETHPDKDHIGGLPEVVKRYKVGLFMRPGVESDNSIDDALETEVEKKNIRTLLARRGQIVDLGDGARLEILYPNTDVSDWDTNDASVVARLSYGESSFLFTGDAALKSEFDLMNLNENILDIDVLKVGHHGSRTSTALAFVEVVTPEYAVISAGKDNTYGHPHKQVLDNLKSVGAQVLSTIEEGTIRFVTNGEYLKVK
jgi:competence protein ComEC